MVRRLLLFIAFALVVAACSNAASDGSTTTESAGPSPTEVTETTSGGSSGEDSTSTTAGSTTTRPDPTWTELPGLEDLPQELQDELLALVRKTEELRGLVFYEPPIITVVSDAELERRVRELWEEDAEDFPADNALYKLLGMLDEADDFETTLVDLYGDSVLGFYEGDTAELVVAIDDDGLNAVQKGTMVHELAHSLTDQNFDLFPVWELMFDEERLDQAKSYQSLLEGDATLTELLYLQSLPQDELGEWFALASQVDQSTFEAAPEFLQDTLRFPYDSGLPFVQSFYNEGGWEAVNELYETMPPLPGSSEQIITPSDYGRDLPLVVVAETIDVPGYGLERQSVWGEHGFRIMLDQVLGDAAGLQAADGWGGDTYFQWFDGTNAAFLLVYEGDTEADLEEMKDALVEYAVEAVAEEDFVWVEVFDDQLAFIAADETFVGELIRGELQD